MSNEMCPRGTWFSVTREGESTPSIFAAMASMAEGQSAFRLAGGCSGMTDDERARVLPYFVEGLGGFNGVAISGATSAPDGKPMVTNVPAALVQAGNNCVALGTLPRTADMALPQSGSVSVSEYGDTIDLGQHGVTVVQKDASQVLDWDGDLSFYADFLKGLQNEAEWPVALIVFNGGGVTKKEIEIALASSIPVIVVRGSGRASDEFASQWNGAEGSFDNELLEAARHAGLVDFADFDDPMTLRSAATNFGLLS